MTKVVHESESEPRRKASETSESVEKRRTGERVWVRECSAVRGRASERVYVEYKKTGSSKGEEEVHVR